MLYPAHRDPAVAARALGRLRVEGLELVPPSGPVLLVPTYDSPMDPVLISLALRAVRPVRFLARASL
jgi:1-acyl-sn-glycerol-3-phosphate acyltransferase